jgi:hypothetical protein
MNNHMKTTYKLMSFVIILMMMAGIYISCTDESLVNNGDPTITYVRVTDPASSDSLLVKAFQGNLVAIVGQNLGGAEQIWFNDQRASLTGTYITNTSILVSVPSAIPKVITNKMKIVFVNGKTLDYDFKVEINEPEIQSMDCEYVLAGNVATIRGNYFYEPITVTFQGGVTGELLTVDETLLTVKVPEGAEPGPVTVSTNFGATPSDFWFRDNRNIFISSDPFTGWWNASYVVSNPGASDPAKINGNYIRVRQTIGAWAWTEVVGGPASAMGDISKNIPDDAIIHPADYNFKFEVNTVKPYNNNVIKFNLGINEQNNDQYQWLPPYDTKGQWQTVVIPFNAIAEKQPLPLKPNADGYWARVLFHGPGELDADISFDNFRVVPKKLDQ